MLEISQMSIPRRSVAILLVAAAIGVTLLVASGTITSSARAGSPKTGLSAYIVATNKGPLPACSADGSNCGRANLVMDYIHVINSNSLANQSGRRTVLPNAFVINSVDQQSSVNGVDYPLGDGTFTPPPNVAPFNSSGGRWPATVVCPPGTQPPCTDVQNPAVLPGENIVAFYAGWSHDTTDPTGTWVFTYTIHGTLNGNPVDLTVSAPPIEMTG